MPASSAHPPSPHPFVVEAEQAADVDAIASLVDGAFGPGRLAKTAERLREKSTPVAGFVVRDGGAVIGSVRLWSVKVGPARALFLGPIAVVAAARRGGTGQALVQACVAHARTADVAGVLLVGDMPYFGRFGFEVADQVTLPGPVDRGRLLWWGAPGGGAPHGLARGVRD